MILEHASYRTYLKGVLSERIRRNPVYSLRAMALNLGVTGSQLSEVMNGKANFSSSNALRVAAKLGLNEPEAEYFCSLVQMESENDPSARELLLQKVNRMRRRKKGAEIRDLSLDHFKQIAEWHHSAILELSDVADFEFSVKNVADTLKITKLEAELAIERLARLELIIKDEQGKWKRAPGDFQVRAETPNKALQFFYRQMMQKASTAIEEQSAETRLGGYETVTFSLDALPEARDCMERFFDEMVRISKKYPRKIQIYHLMVHFFSLTPKLNKN